MKPRKKIKNFQHNILENDKFIPKNKIISINIKNKAVVLDIKNKNFYALNETSADILGLLNKRKTIKEIAEKFIREYGVGKKVLIRNIRRIIQEFLINGLVEKLTIHKNNKQI